jgi:hypothetical protein
MTDELKLVPCGCGGEAKVIMLIPEVYAVECSKCYIRTGSPATTESEAITAWNRAMGERTAKVKNVDEINAHCGNCDTPLSDWWTYCPNCGARLEWNHE